MRLSVEGRRKKKEENVLLLLAAAVGDPHSLFCKVVTLPTFQPPMGWLNFSAL